MIPAEKLGDLAASAGLRRILMLAWRDLEDPEAGGSEIHAATIARLWAEAGIEVTMRTSRADGLPTITWRDGYRVVRKAGRHVVFPRSALSGLVNRMGRHDALVEIWNGMPFFSPLWHRGPHVVFLHHVHAEMWRMVLEPEALARLGELIEFRLAPPVYRRTRIVTLSESSRQEIGELLRLPVDNVSVVTPGVDARFSPGGRRAPHPLVVAVGRLVPVKRYDLLLDVLARVKARHPDLEAVIVGDGYERPALEACRRSLSADEWVHLPGRIDDDALVDLYRRAWVLASTSLREGWGMTITEAASCATPAVATRIAGHADAVVDGRTGFLADSVDELAARLDEILSDASMRQRFGQSALDHAARFTWAETARGTLQTLVDVAIARRNGRPARPQGG